MRTRLAQCLAAVIIGLVASTSVAQERVSPISVDTSWVFMPTPGVFDRDDMVRFSSSDEAKRLIERIMGKVGLAPRFEVYAGPVGNAAARIEDGGVRVIYYSESWVQRTMAQDEWMAIALLAHEVGHHLNNHTLQRLDDRPLQELEADKFSGFVVGKLGGSLDDAQRLYQSLPALGGRTHPDRPDRLEAVAVGWREGSTGTNVPRQALFYVADNKPIYECSDGRVGSGEYGNRDIPSCLQVTANPNPSQYVCAEGGFQSVRVTNRCDYAVKAYIAINDDGLTQKEETLQPDAPPLEIGGCPAGRYWVAAYPPEICPASRNARIVR